MTGLAPNRAETAEGGRAPRDERARAGLHLLRTFDGLEPTPALLAAISAGGASGVTLFRARNIGSPAAVRRLAEALQAARPAGDPPLIVGLDQEGGQLQAVGYGATAWPGNLALGAARSEDLARRFGRAVAMEVAALGGTLVFAPDCDVLTPVSATPLGTRSFGSDPELVARLASAMVRGIAETGVASTIKHFPGHGAAVGDSHLGMPVVARSRAELEASDLAPFRAAIAAGASAVMPGHLGVPALSDGELVAATISPGILRGLLRDTLGFEGVSVSDALDMGGAGTLAGIAGTAVAAVGAGVDLLLLVHPPEVEEAVLAALAAAAGSGRLDRDRLAASRERILSLRSALAAIAQPTLDAVGCDAHRALAREIAARSITLVSSQDGALPLSSDSGRTAVVAPVPVDLTPAETSSYLPLGLAAALRERGLAIDEFVAPLDPTPAQVAALAAAVADHPVAIVGTFDAVSFAGQADLVRAVAGRAGGGGGAARTIAVALRSPYDAALYPASAAAVCTYGIQPPQIEALADALVGRSGFAGVLPVELEPPDGRAPAVRLEQAATAGSPAGSKPHVDSTPAVSSVPADAAGPAVNRRPSGATNAPGHHPEGSPS